MDKEFAEAFKEEIEKEASTYRDKARDDEKKKKRHFAFGGKKDKTRHGAGGYGKGSEEVEEGVSLQVKMALSDVGLKGTWKDNKVFVKKKDVKKAEKLIRTKYFLSARKR